MALTRSHRKFFGGSNAANPQQSKLAFSSTSGAEVKRSAKDGSKQPHVKSETKEDEDSNVQILKEEADDDAIDTTHELVKQEDTESGLQQNGEGKILEPRDSPQTSHKRAATDKPDVEEPSDDEPPTKKQRRKPTTTKSGSTEIKAEESDKSNKQSRTKAISKDTHLADVEPKKSQAATLDHANSSTTAEQKSSKGSTAKLKKEKSESSNDDRDAQPVKTKPALRLDEIQADQSEAEVSEDEEVEASEDEKPEVAAKAREKVQSTLKSNTKDLYPDWKPGEPVPYAALCTTFSKVEMTTKRLEISAHCSLFLRQVLRLTPQDLLPTVLLMVNKLAADYSGIELGIGESLIMKAIGETTGRGMEKVKADQNEIGDLGLVAAKSRSNQPTMFKPKPLTVRGVHDGLMAIATITGHGSQGNKIAGIKKLLSAADAHLAGKGSRGIDITKDKGGPSETKYIVRTLEGKMRLGLAEKTVVVALAQAMIMHESPDKVPSTEQLAAGEATLKAVYK